MWEFMVEYANDFWEQGSYSFEIIKVIMAWAITLGAACFVTVNIAAIGAVIADNIKNWRKGG